MEFQSLLAKYPNIRLASEKDNDQILEYYHKSPIHQGAEQIQYKRGHNFFAFLKERSDSFLVLILEDEENEIQGIAVISYRKGFIDGELTTVGYVGDLRVSLNRKLIRQWRGMLTDFFQYTSVMSETKYCKHYYTAIINSNAFSRVNLIHTKIKGVKFQELAPYTMLNIIGAFLPPELKKPKLKMEFANNKNFNDFSSFFNKGHKELQFGQDQQKEMERKINKLSLFSKNNYFAIKKDEKILAMSYYWNPKTTKQVVTTKIPSIFKFIHKLTKVMPFMQMTSFPKANIPMDILYLSHITWDNSLSENDKKEIIRFIMAKLIKTFPEINILAYADFDQNNYARYLNGYIYQKIPMGFYTVHGLDDENQMRFPIFSNGEPPYFEMEMV